MADCIWQPHQHGMKCKRCGRLIRSQNTAIKAHCRRKGWGDMVAAVLTSLGLQKCSGCRDRQQKLNELEDKIRRLGG